MSVLKLSTVLVAVSFTLGCSSDRSPPPPPPKTVFDPLTQQLDRARDVQKTVDQNTDNTRNAVDSQERGDSPPHGDNPERSGNSP
jgi:hypothetical protein